MLSLPLGIFLPLEISLLRSRAKVLEVVFEFFWGHLKCDLEGEAMAVSYTIVGTAATGCIG